MGRLQLAESQLFGGRGAVMLGPTRDIASHTVVGDPLAAEAAEALLWVEGHLCGARPRPVRCGQLERPSIIFTDGAFEPDRRGQPWARIGGCLLDPLAAQHAYYRADLSKHLLREWAVGGSTQLIA